MTYFFIVNVREGDRGFADDDSYRSSNFDTLEACTRAYYDFKPELRWRHLRCVRSVEFYKNGCLLKSY
jgi:hypothetical protein